MFTRHQSFRYLSVEKLRHVKAVVCLATTEEEETLHRRSLIPFKPLATGAPVTLKCGTVRDQTCVHSCVDAGAGKFEGS